MWVPRLVLVLGLGYILAVWIFFSPCLASVGTCTLWWRLKGQGFKAILGYIANKRPDWATRDCASKIKK